MSNTRNQQLRCWEDIEASLRCNVFWYQNRPVSSDDCQSMAVAWTLFGLMSEDLLSSCSSDRRRRVKALCKNASDIDIYDLGTMIKKIPAALLSGIYSSYDAFKQHLQESSYLPKLGLFLAPVKEEVEAYIASPTSASFSIIYQYCCFMSRVSLKSIDLSSISLRTYLDSEQHLAEFKYDPILIDELNVIMKEWLGGFELGLFRPKHGPGSTAETSRFSATQKFATMNIDAMLSYVFRDASDYFPRIPNRDLKRECKVVFVPKSMLSWRTISMEPTTLQYFQQGVWNSLDQFLQKHRQLRKTLHIHDQTQNRDMAGLGSANPSLYSTIDLSSASDEVGWELVKGVFRGTPLLKYLYATRSREALLPDGSRLRLKKFAPMGSALCFPIECLIFACITENCVRKLGVRWKVLPYSVYGDDIVLTTALYPSVTRDLVRAGFHVNYAKSFCSLSVPFRESCGGEFFGGNNITPLRLSRRFSGPPMSASPSLVGSWIDLANNAGQHNLTALRAFCIRKLLSLPKRLQVPFGNGECFQLFSPQPTNYHLTRRWDNRWQCWTAEVLGFFPQYVERSKEVELDDCRLFEWLRQTQDRDRPPQTYEDVVTIHTTLPRVHPYTRRIPMTW